MREIQRIQMTPGYACQLKNAVKGTVDVDKEQVEISFYVENEVPIGLLIKGKEMLDQIIPFNNVKEIRLKESRESNTKVKKQ